MEITLLGNDLLRVERDVKLLSLTHLTWDTLLWDDFPRTSLSGSIG